jgi:transcriptional regulator with XRE-family HTH domain
VRGFSPAALVQLRRSRGLTQERLGELIGRARTNVIRWEKLVDTPSPRYLVKVASALQVRPWQLTSVDPAEATLADLRAWAGLTQLELADAAGLPRSTYSLLERGGLPLRADLAEGIAAVLGCDASEVEAAYRRAKASTPAEA